MKKIIGFIVLIILVVVSFLILKSFNKKEEKFEYNDSISIKIGDDIPSLDDYLKSDDLSKIEDKTINWKDINIDDGKVYYHGIYRGTFKYKDESKIVYLTVIDDIAPTIEGVKDFNIYVGDNIDMLKNIKVTDNSKDNIDLNIKGEYNFNKEGIYNLSYEAVDRSENKTTKEFKLVVNKKQEPKPQVNNDLKTESLGTTSKGYKIEKINGIYYVNGILIANKTYSLPSSYNPGALTTTFNTAFNKMANDALKDGVNLRVISGFRSYNTQVSLYNNYVARDGKAAADTYSARAGHSEHQTGLAADINSLEQSFINTKEGKWLNDNCANYGFIVRYPKGKESITGYMYEPWHIRYVGESVAKDLYNNGNWITLEEYLGITSKY